MKWIHVSERMPEPSRDSVSGKKHGHYLILTGYRSFRDRWLINCYDADQSHSGVGYTRPDNNVEYWARIGNTPKIKKDETKV